MEDSIIKLYREYSGEEPTKVELLPQSGSHRKYYRITGPKGNTVIGAEGESYKECRSFIALCQHFHSKGINVPEIYAVSDDSLHYLQQDLGDRTLYSLLAEGRGSGTYSVAERRLLLKTIAQLPKIQFEGGEGLDYSLCLSESHISERSIKFDLHYFKYCFLKPSGLSYDEGLLEDDFEALCRDLLQVPSEGFLYRDFQARNVMIVDDEPYFIDFQDGRRGPIYYDLSSFVYQARSRFPASLKDELINEYRRVLAHYVNVPDEEFYPNLRLFVFFRTLQVLAAYGFRGNYERKAHFLESIPYALANLRECLPQPRYPYLSRVLTQMVDKLLAVEKHDQDTAPKASDKGPLVVDIFSFSYKKGIPADHSGNGGGYVFDCRAIHNPGRYEEYKSLTGKDVAVRDFLLANSTVQQFLEHVYGLVDENVEVYLRRGFTHLQVSFGCTGGQHRSVFCAESLASHLGAKYPEVKINLVHREQQ